jgi:glycyl-tRNA synthetase alpha subunit
MDMRRLRAARYSTVELKISYGSELFTTYIHDLDNVLKMDFGVRSRHN